MKKIISIFLLSVILCSLYAQNKAGGNVNSKEPIAYADKEFLTGILDYDSLKNTPAPQNWPEPLNNTFKFTYVTGECRMIPSQFLFDAAKKLGVEKEYNSDQIDSEEYPEVTCKLTGILIQKTDDEYLVRAFYEADDIIPDTVSNMRDRPWYINNNPKKHFQAIYRPGKGVIKIIDDAYSLYTPQGPTPSCVQTKVYSAFDSLSKKNFVHTVLSLSVQDEISVGRLHCDIFDKADVKNATHTYSFIYSDLFDYVEKRRPMKTAEFVTFNALIENKVFDYTIDKMLDLNPSTSYVENSDDNNINFTVVFSNRKRNIKGLRIINGFAKNNNLYMSNNQVKTIVIKGYDNASIKPSFEKTWNLKQTIDYQIIKFDFPDCDQLEIESTEIYKGTKYNDTCIAEFDILTDEGWLISDN